MKHSSVITFIFLTGISVGCINNTSLSSGEVKIYEEDISIPSYPVGEPEKNPIFYTFENCQGAQSRIYPYPMLDKLTDEKVDQSYTGLFLENEYLKICVLPELGGRLYIARDKSNNYDFIYHNEVIKPALIGMAGAWISGGIEWNIPHHHRVSTLMPVDYTLVENEDGSKTIWVGEYEKRHHTKWMVGLTLSPGRSNVETEIRLFNATPTAQSALIWVNPAVHVNEEYQVIFPPDVTKAVYHHKIEFTDWPVSRQVYLGLDFTEGVDVSWWKNTTSPTSFFAWNTKEDFLAGIDHGKNAGTVLVANHHIFPGKKMWNWGNNEIARLWDQMLTDSNGPYIELMMGAYSDNQPDYSWYQPYAMRKGKLDLYPVKDMKGIKQANKDLAANLEINEGTAFVQLSGTKSIQDITMSLSRNHDLLSEQTVDLVPDQTIVWNVELPSLINPTELVLQVRSNDGGELLSYAPPVREVTPHPELYSPPKEPAQIKDLENLYLAGLRLEQFGNPDLDPNAYWDEVLKRDPDNIWVNTQLGMKQIIQMDYENAVDRLGGVAAKITGNYTSPKFGEPLYYLGIALMKAGQPDKAYEILYKSAWHLEWASASYFNIAILDCRNQHFEKALEHLNLSLESNQNNLEAIQLKALVLRKLGKYEKAFLLSKHLLDLDPLNFIALTEQYFLSAENKGKGVPGKVNEMIRKRLRDEPDNYLETASRYGNAGLLNDAINVLEMASESGLSRLANYPMIHYHQGYYYMAQGNLEKSLEQFRKAEELPKDYCFPHLPSSEKALQAAIQGNPMGASAYYYLGNLLCDHQPVRSLELWEEAIKLDPNVAVFHRNAAFVQANYLDNMELAAASIGKAVELDGSDPLYLNEQDRYLAYMNQTPEMRLKILESNRETVQNSDATLARYVNLLVIEGNYDEAIQILNEWHFHSAEDAGPNVHEQWTDAHLLRGREYLKKGLFDKALSDFNTAMQFPRNLESATDSRIVLGLYFMAEAYRMEGNPEQAKEHYQKMVDFEISQGWRERNWPDIHYYTALARKSLGEKAEAKEMFNELIQKGMEMTKEEPHQAWYLSSVKRRKALIHAEANGYFSIGLGYLGLGNSSKAAEMFKKTRAMDQAHLGARLFLQ